MKFWENDHETTLKVFAGNRIVVSKARYQVFDSGFPIPKFRFGHSIQTRIFNVFIFWSYGIFFWVNFLNGNKLPTPGYMTQINTSLTYYMWHVWQKRTLKRFKFTYSEYQQTKSLIGLEMTQRVKTVVRKSLNRGESGVKWGVTEV